MGKRHLSQQQQRRILAGRRASPAPRNPSENAGEAERKGLVVARYGKEVDVLDLEDPAARAQRCRLRSHLEPVVGDRVRWHQDALHKVVVALEPRRSVLRRRERTGIRVLAANVDQIALVIAPQPEPHPTLVDRFLATAELEGIGALIVVNKSDLANQEQVDAIARSRARLGYPLVRVSAHCGQGVEALMAHLQGRISVFCGQSGVGKSSLINRLFPQANASVGQLSAAAAKGRHTTTVARYYVLADSTPSEGQPPEVGGHPAGAVIDSPGIREFDVPATGADELLQGFTELRDLAANCRFRNCRHHDDPGCAILAASALHRIDPGRLASFHQLLNAD